MIQSSLFPKTPASSFHSWNWMTFFGNSSFLLPQPRNGWRGSQRLTAIQTRTTTLKIASDSASWIVKAVQLLGIRDQQTNCQSVLKCPAWKQLSPTTIKFTIPVRKNWRNWQGAVYHALTLTMRYLIPLITQLLLSTMPQPIWSQKKRSCFSLLTPWSVSLEGLSGSFWAFHSLEHCQRWRYGSRPFSQWWEPTNLDFRQTRNGKKNE